MSERNYDENTISRNCAYQQKIESKYVAVYKSSCQNVVNVFSLRGENYIGLTVYPVWGR